MLTKKEKGVKFIKQVSLIAESIEIGFDKYIPYEELVLESIEKFCEAEEPDLSFYTFLVTATYNKYKESEGNNQPKSIEEALKSLMEYSTLDS